VAYLYLTGHVLFVLAPMLSNGALQMTFLRDHNLAKDEENYPGKFFAGVLRPLKTLVGEVSLLFRFLIERFYLIYPETNIREIQPLTVKLNKKF